MGDVMLLVIETKERLRASKVKKSMIVQQRIVSSFALVVLMESVLKQCYMNTLPWPLTGLVSRSHPSARPFPDVLGLILPSCEGGSARHTSTFA